MAVHRQERAAAVTFAVLGLAQLAWGLVALRRSGRALAAVGVALGGLAVTGWVLAKTRGLSAIGGLEEVEAIQWSDATAAALGLVAALLALRRLATDGAPVGTARPAVLRVAVVGLTLATMAAMVNAPGHAHQGGHDGGDHGHRDAGVVAAARYDPAEPVDLSGAATVTPEEQARAEDLVTETLAVAPRFASVADAEAAGYTSIGDAASGYEHLVRWAAVGDDARLDPSAPEALVYAVAADGRRTLAGVVYLLPERTPLAEVPDVGGALTVWSLWRDLCRDPGTDDPQVRGRTDAAGACTPPLVPVAPVPRLPVWVVANDCGPFVAPSPSGDRC